jgi:methionyl-tRNA formyltransferase
MNYKVVVFGVKDTSENIIDFIRRELCPVDLVITIAPKVTEHNQISGFKGLSFLTEKYGIPVFEADSYSLTDEKTQKFIRENSFDLGIVMGWQRLIPPTVLNAFSKGIYGFHGNCGYLPFGRGRSPLNWSMILGDTRFNLNLFRYDEKADSPNVFATEMFQISGHDDIRTAQYKNMICSKNLIRRLIEAYLTGKEIPIRTESKDFDSWYSKRTAEDGKIDFHERTRNIYNLIRGVAAPFPGAFCFAGGKKMTVWEAHPFDEMIDFSRYAPGEIIDVFDGRLVVRTVDGSLLIDRFEYDGDPVPGDILS